MIAHSLCRTDVIGDNGQEKQGRDYDPTFTSSLGTRVKQRVIAEKPSLWGSAGGPILSPRSSIKEEAVTIGALKQQASSTASYTDLILGFLLFSCLLKYPQRDLRRQCLHKTRLEYGEEIKSIRDKSSQD